MHGCGQVFGYGPGLATILAHYNIFMEDQLSMHASLGSYVCTYYYNYMGIWPVITIYLSLRGLDECVPLEQLNEDYLGLKQRKSHPNTAAWTKTKGHMAHLRSLCFLLCTEPIHSRYAIHVENVHVSICYLSGSNVSGSFQ